MKVIRKISLFASVLGAWGLAASSALAGTEVGQITDARGTAGIVRASTQAEEKVKVFAPVFQGDQLVTGKDGRIKVLFSDDSVISLAPDTAFKVDQMVYDPAKQERTGLMSLLRGRIRGFVAKYGEAIKSKYNISTPTAVAGIRGTILTMGTNTGGAGKEFCAMEEGSVEWCQGSNCITVPAGKIAFIGADGKWVQPVDMTSGDYGNYVDPAAMDEQPPDMGEGSGAGLGGDPTPPEPPAGFEGAAILDVNEPTFNTDVSGGVPIGIKGATILNLNLSLP